MTYAEIVSASTAVEKQNRLIAAGKSPTDEERKVVMSNSSLKRNNPVSLTSK